MKRNMDLIRKILFAIEAHPTFDRPIELEELNIGETTDLVSYHVMLLAQAGLVDATAETVIGGKHQEWRPECLTWEGHDFLEAIKDNQRWQKAKATMREKGGGIVFEVLKKLLIKYMEHQVFGE